MKENRLIELLDEYDSVQYHKINHKIENGSIYRNVGGTDGWHEVWRYCKQFGFIQRLVDHDRIDLDKLLKGIKENKIYCGKYGKTRNMLLMLLAVSNSPIKDLISYLR